MTGTIHCNRCNQPRSLSVQPCPSCRSPEYRMTDELAKEIEREAAERLAERRAKKK